MKKTSKILSLLVALCMAVTMLSGLTVMAEDALQLVSYDADADFITLDFNKAIDTENSVIVLRKDGVNVPFTIKDDLHHANVQTKSSSRYTYMIVPEGGVELSAEYKITLWDVKASETDILAPTAMTFIVAELAADANLANIKPYAWPITWSRNNTTGGLSITNKAITTTLKNGYYETSNNMSVHAFAGALIGADKEAGNTLPNKSSSSGSATGTGTWTETNYTTKITFKTDEKIARSNIHFGIARDLTNLHGGSTTDYTALSLSGYAYQAANQQIPNIYLYDGQRDTTAADKRKTVESLAGDDRVSVKLDYTAGVELKLSVKDSVARAFINDKKVIDAPVSGVPGHPFFAVRPTFSATYTETNEETGETTTVPYNTFSMDLYDFQVTKASFNPAEPDDPNAAPEEPEVPAGPVESPEMILDWDADLDVFTIDFAEEVAEFEATITQAGTNIPATVSYANYNENARTSRYTWMIKPADNSGFKAEIPYTVSIANVLNVDEENQKKITSWSKIFKVEVLAEGLNLNEGTTHSIEKTGSNATFTNVGDDLVVSASAYASDKVDSSKLHVFKALDSGEHESNYTVKVTLKDFVNMNYTQGAVGFTNTSATNYGWDHASMGGAVAYWKTGNGSTGNNAIYAAIYQKGDGTTASANAGNFTTYAFRSNPIEIKLAVKNQNASSYFNGLKTCDTALDANYAGRPQIMINLRSIIDTTKPASVTYADFVATRAVETELASEEFVFGAVTVAEGAIADKETVNISTVLTNNVIASKNIFAVCALYDATDVMKNVVISEVSVAEAGKTNVEFKNVDVNGATYAKVFIWDNALTLNPYFPAKPVQ